MNDNFKGVWIPAELWRCKKLKLIEKLFLTQIYSLDNAEGCTAGNTYFSEFFDMTKSRCSQIIKSLEKKKMIKITIERDGKLITKRVCKILNLGMYYFKHPMKNIKFGYVENAEDNNTKENNKEEESFDKRIDKNLPFDVVTSSQTLNALFQDKRKAIELVKDTFQIDATEKDVTTAIFSFSTTAVATYDAYRGIRTLEKLVNKFIDWIPKSIKYQSTKIDTPQPETLDLKAYYLQYFREVDLKHAIKDGSFARWSKELEENKFRLGNIAKTYKNKTFTTLLLFELCYMPLGNRLGGSNPQRKLESLIRIYNKFTDYNKNQGDMRQLFDEWRKNQSL